MNPTGRGRWGEPHGKRGNPPEGPLAHPHGEPRARARCRGTAPRPAHLAGLPPPLPQKSRFPALQQGLHLPQPLHGGPGPGPAPGAAAAPRPPGAAGAGERGLRAPGERTSRSRRASASRNGRSGDGQRREPVGERGALPSLVGPPARRSALSDWLEGRRGYAHARKRGGRAAAAGARRRVGGCGRARGEWAALGGAMFCGGSL